MADPPGHTRTRKLLTAAFTSKAVARLEERARAITNEHLNRILAKGEFEMMADLANLLPMIILAEMLGVDPARRAEFKRWSDDAMIVVARDHSEEDVLRIVQSRKDFRAFFRALIVECRESPREDLISDLVRAQVEGDMLTADEVVRLSIILLLAGNVTTTNLHGNGMNLLLRHPEALAMLRADETLIPGFIEEVLRSDGNAKFLPRRTARETTIAGVTIPKDEYVIALLASANRDPTHFPDPDRFDIEREQCDHVAFGFGIHSCVGAPLARLEGKVVFEEILRRLPDFSAAEEQRVWMRSATIRGLKRLPIKLNRKMVTAAQ